MTTATNSQTKILMFAAVGVGLFLLSTRKANAGTLTANSSNPASRQFFQSPAVASAARPASTATSSGGSVFGSVLKAAPAALHALLNPALVRTPDFIPSYNFDTSGEAAARDYYLSNPDAFASNPPSSYQTYTDSYGGIDSR